MAYVVKLQPEDFRVATWFERDRANVRVDIDLEHTSIARGFDNTVFDVWDQGVTELIEDGYLDSRNIESSAITYAMEHDLHTTKQAILQEKADAMYEALCRVVERVDDEDADVEEYLSDEIAEGRVPEASEADGYLPKRIFQEVLEMAAAYVLEAPAIALR